MFKRKVALGGLGEERSKLEGSTKSAKSKD